MKLMIVLFVVLACLILFPIKTMFAILTIATGVISFCVLIVAIILAIVS